MKNYIWLIVALTTGFTGVAEESATINRAKINVRGGPSFASEVIGQLQKGDPVTFIEEVTIEKPKPGEPSKWAAIKLPAKTPVWVFIDFLNDKTVKAPRLNLRAGPGENYSVVGRLQRGDTVKEIRTVEGWMQIETPENARAYVDATYVTRATAPAVAATPTPEPIKVFEPKKEEPTIVAAKPAETPAPPVETPKPVETAKPIETPPPAEVAKVETPKVEPVVVKEEPAPAVAAKPEETKPATTTTPEPAPIESPKVTPLNTATTPPPVAEKPPENARVLPQVGQPVLMSTNVVLTKRLVRREGEVRSTKFNIQAPTYFELVNEGKVINYLSAEKMDFKLKDFRGLRVIVTGEESIEPRFPQRPLLELETIEVAP